MKTYLLIFTLLSSVASFGQDAIYCTDLSGKIKKITANPVTGTTAGSFADVKNIPASAALGADANGWLYFLKYGNSATGEQDGKVKIYATRADGSGNESQIALADLNGNSNKELTFVRLGVDNAGTGWIVAAETGLNPKIILAKFTCTGSAATTVTVVSSNVTISDGNSSIFVNGDICFDGKGAMYALANDGMGSTKIYTMKPSAIVNGIAVLTYKWSLKTNIAGVATNFSGQVGGCAFSSSGSMYISTTGGIYFIDQNTVNFAGAGTVECKLIKSCTFTMSDLATAFWPAETNLPVHFKSFEVKAIGKGMVELTFVVEESQTTNRFEVELSLDNGRTFKTVCIVFPDTFKPNHTYTLTVKI